MKKYQLDLVLAISTALTSLFCRTRRNRFDNRALLLCAVAGLLLTAAASRAVEVTWTGSTNSNWSNNGNWDVHVPLSGDSVFFPNTGQTNVRADFSSYPDTDPQRFNQPALHLESVTFAAGAPSRSIELYTSAETSTFYQANLTFDGAGVTNSSAVEQTFVVDKGSLRALAGGQYTGVDGSTLTFNNSASAGTNVTYEAKGGLTTFFSNPAGTILFLRPSGGSIIFNNSASAAGATFIAQGGAGNGGPRSRVEFHNSSTAASGTFFNNAGTPAGNAPGEYPPVVCGFGGETIFFDTASAGTAHFTNDGTAGPGGSGGVTTFTQNSSAANGVFVSNPTTDTSGIGNPGIVQFLDSATAANGTFTNNGGPISYSNGRTEFWNNSTAANALIENLAGESNYFGATTTFHDHASAGSAVINNRVHSGMGAGLPPVTSFRNESTAGGATIHNWGSSLSGTDYGGRTEFYDHATAANAHIILEPGNHGGTIVFNNDSTAAAANIDATANNTNGNILFKDQSTAANAVVALGSTNSGQSLTFSNDASAGNSTITIGKQSNLGFYNKSTAANSNINMGSNSSLFFTGSIDGPPGSTAGSATIHLVGGTASASGATATFANFSTAASANITVDGAADANPAATGASILFGSNANAGSANIFLKSGPAAGSAGGLLYFNGGGSGPMARVITEAGSLIYVVGNVDYGTTVGSIEGPADVLLGGSKLTVGGLNLSTTLAGTISGVGGQLTKIGSGRLTVSGANTFNGLTTVEAGEFALTGSVGGNVDVKSGAAFLGTGNVTHGLNCEAGSICKPGLSPGTLTLGGLNLMSGSTLQFELGTVRDHIVLTNSGNVTLGGLLELTLLGGFNPALGQTFSLFEGSIGSITGTFSAVNAPIFNGHALNLVYGVNQVTLVVGESGDFNGDGAVNAADYVVWRKGLGTIYTQDDYSAWRAHFGQTAGSGAGASANIAVPEPATWAMILGAPYLLGLGIGGRRRTCGAAPTYRLLPVHAPRAVQFAVFAITSLQLGGSVSGSTTWTNPSLGNWFIASNWSAGVPDFLDEVSIPAGTAFVSSPGGANIGMTLGNSGGNGSLIISNGGVLSQHGDAYVGASAGSNSAVTVTGVGSFWEPVGLTLGGAPLMASGGTGTLRIESGGRVDSLGGYLAPDSVSSNGSAIVTGAGSTWNCGLGMSIGGRGTGSLTISSGGTVDSGLFGGAIGDFTGSTGSVTVTGAGSRWIGEGGIGVGGSGTAANGRNGNGTLQISSGGLVQAGYIQVFDTGSAQVNNGSSTVSGITVSGGLAPGEINSPLGALTVGNTASGRMVVQTGGTVSNSFGTIGANSGTIGSVLVQDANSTWTNTDQVVAGLSGTGTLEVRGGGTLTSFRGIAGANANSIGTITVSDPGSTWAASGSFFIGNSGSGLLEVLNGGVASTTGNSHLGITPGANGDVNVSGAGSTLNVAVLLNIGGDSAQAQGSGSVRIADGGAVNVGTATNLYSTGRLDIVNETTLTGDLNSFGGLIRVIGNTAVANAVHLNTGGVAIVNFTAGTNSTFSGNIDGSGGLLKGGIAGFTGLGTLTLTGANTYLGPTTINAGTLLVNGSITSATTVNTGATLGGIGTVGTVTVKNGGILSPGNSPGLLTAAAVTFGSGVPKLAIEFGGTAPGTQYDQLHVTGNLSLAGTLTVSLIDGFAPVAGHAFDILDWGSLSGTFASINLPTLAAGLSWNTSQLYATGLLSVGLPGDYNNNGEVDAPDYVVWRKGLGTIYTSTDYDVWRVNFGATAGSGSGSAANANSFRTASSNVPEPSSSALLMVCFVAGRLIRLRPRPQQEK